jgi:transcriptional regulator GlxA family with amidase domain
MLERSSIVAYGLKLRSGMNSSIDWRITWAMDHMQRHLAGPLSVPELAARVHLSPSRFRELFSAQAGVGPVEYLQQLRLRRARLLIERTFLTVKEVMAIVGYNDPSHFSRDFRRYHGVTPSSLRGSDLTTALPHEEPDGPNPPTVKRTRQRRPREPGFVYA